MPIWIRLDEDENRFIDETIKQIYLFCAEREAPVNGPDAGKAKRVDLFCVSKDESKQIKQTDDWTASTSA